MNELKGVYPVLPTPFDENEEISYSDLLNMVDFAIECKVQGITINEFFSEFYLFTDDERKSVTEAVLTHAAGRIPVIVGVSATTPMLSAAWAEHAQENGAAAVLCSPPYLFPYMWPDIVDRGFSAMNQKLRIPVIIQNCPADRSGSNLNAVIGREQAKFLLSEFENFQYYKDDSPGIQVEITKFMETVKNLPEGMFKGFFTGTNGNDMHDDYLRGATGFMPGLHLADSKEAGWRLLEAGEYSKALEMQMKLTPLYCFERLYQLDVCKQILKRRGVIFNTKSRRANMTVFNAPAEKEFNRIYDRLKTAARL